MAFKLAEAFVELSARGFGQVHSQIGRIKSDFIGLGTAIRGIPGMLSGIVAGAGLKAMMDMAISAEQTSTAFTVLLRDAELAGNVIGNLRQFAAETPFQEDEILTSAKALLAFGSNAKDVTGEVKMLGEIASGLGLRLDDLAQLFGTSRVQGRLFAQDVRQFTARGIPLIQALAATMGTTEANVSELVSAGKVGFPQLLAALRAMTDEGGQFNGMLDKMSQTLGGRLSTAMDNLKVQARDIGTILAEVWVPAVEGFADHVDTMRKGMGDKGLEQIWGSANSREGAVSGRQGIGALRQALTDNWKDTEVVMGKMEAAQRKLENVLLDEGGPNLLTMFGESAALKSQIDQLRQTLDKLDAERTRAATLAHQMERGAFSVFGKLGGSAAGPLDKIFDVRANLANFRQLGGGIAEGFVEGFKNAKSAIRDLAMKAMFAPVGDPIGDLNRQEALHKNRAQQQAIADKIFNLEDRLFGLNEQSIARGQRGTAAFHDLTSYAKNLQMGISNMDPNKRVVEKLEKQVRELQQQSKHLQKIEANTEKFDGAARFGH